MWLFLYIRNIPTNDVLIAINTHIDNNSCSRTSHNDNNNSEQWTIAGSHNTIMANNV